jgi:phosphopantothenoylcysteine decarboxylase/phosphopantothenate--cysteine ligase
MKRIVIGITGSIACYKTCDVVSALRKEKDLSVHVVMTKEATKFVSPLTFQTLSGNKVYDDVFDAPEEWDLLHTSLSAQADLVVVCPATLNVIGKMANGICDDLLTCILFATRAPVVVVPAMNTGMYEHPVTQENIAKLKKLGVEFVGPVRGELACREIGMGHIAESAHILTEIKRRLAKRGKR